MAAGTAFAVDTGGTFTDLLVERGGELHLFKAPTTPEDPVVGMLDVLAVAADGLGRSREDLLAEAELFIHGTTRAINALVTGNTARTAFLTTAGHPDILLFREGGRSEPFNYRNPFPEPLIPRGLTFEVPGRISAEGEVVEEFDEDAAAVVIDRLREAEVEAVGVALLWSIINPVHELRVAELLEERLPGVPFTLSHRLNPTLREYRRASSACIDASLKPVMTEYFSSLDRRLRRAGFDGRLLIVSSQGGMLDAADVAAAPIHSINSGPSMAPVAGHHFVVDELATDTAIVADTGGTTFDVSLVRGGQIPRTRETWIGPPQHGHITGFPSVDVTSVGAGGGSIAWVDGGGLLHVGPQSAGSTPGPACYARGGEEPTVTDACVVLGYLDPEAFLGGSMTLDGERAREAVLRGVARPLGLELEESAEAIMRIATENMVHAIEQITVHQGIDARDAVLVGGGGAAGLNLVAIAARLGCRHVLFPETGAALSASGALLSDISTEFAKAHLTATDDFDFDGVGAVLAELGERAASFLRGADVGATAGVRYSAEARYRRQIWEIEVPLSGDRIATAADVREFEQAFHLEHERLFAIKEPDAPVEVVAWRARPYLRLQRDGGRRMATPEGRSAPGATRRVWDGGSGWTDARLVAFETAPTGEEFAGPAIVESAFTTVVVDPGARARKSDSGGLLVDLGEVRR
jgi:N-methylhydantoinase A